ncbi:probable short chain dehydrogenase/reductase [Cephalotrichum gorgonifer]|uniref:Probable short chain dehydrogenase/reductase n=1 Tax=Cephalotrichum gorgonifer TaxID=2041049 RepID=A0AAE8N8Y1_9PEZI|nr:probable short chain dehydrogenase/reductase [Cephalotrichum gorgonifer]
MASTNIQKSVVVTGGASGIGLAMTRHFASQGHKVSVLDINDKTGPGIIAEVAAEYPQATLSFRRGDVSSWEDQAAAFEQIFRDHGRIDVVMANAGISEQGQSSVVEVEGDVPKKPATKSIEVNFLGVIYSVKLAVHYMHKNTDDSSPSRGSIIVTASNAGLYPFPVAPLYAASKAGVINLVRSMAPVLAKSNIQINALAPAVLETNIAPSSDLFKDMIITPMSTLTAGVARLIADPSLTGQVAEIHGESVTPRLPPDYVDEDSRKNLETFWNLGFA